MNFYKHHLGDYDGATVHLSWDEDQAYTRLLRVYYRLEKPIPLDPGAAYRLVRAVSKAQKEAVTRVLHEFFQEQADGWHNARCDEEIAAYQAQSSTNRRIARERNVGRSADESLHESSHGSSTKRAPNHKPRTSNQEPVATAPVSGKAPETSAGTTLSTAARRPRKDGEAKSGPAWEAYIAAYRQRYGTEPTRNAVENAAMAAFVELVPLEEAPQIAAFYVRHSKAWYVSHQHSVKFLRQDAAGLRTQWLAGTRVTDTSARQADRTAARGEVFTDLLLEAGGNA